MNKGYWVFRMGKVMHKPLEIKHKRFVDYPYIKYHYDLIDIWLTVNCDLLISTGTGLDALAWVYGKQLVLYVNALPLFLSATSTRHMWVPKNLKWKSNGCMLSLKQHSNNAHLSSSYYSKSGILIGGMSSKQIRDVVSECEKRISGSWIDFDSDLNRQLKYLEVFSRTPNFYEFHNYIHPEAKIGSAWLKSMGEEFFE